MKNSLGDSMSETENKRSIDLTALSASCDDAILEDFISCKKGFIVSCAWKVYGTHIHKNGEEECLAVEAFVEAVKSYSFEKGSFLSFAELVIKRRTIDAIRKRRRQENIVAMDPRELAIEQDKGRAEAHRTEESAQTDMALEIESVSKQLQLYGFSFFDLIHCSPKAEKTKEACEKAVRFIVSREALFSEMRETGQLSIKIIEKNTGIPRKVLERHRKYIMAISEIVFGKYPCLAGYVNNIKRRSEE